MGWLGLHDRRSHNRNGVGYGAWTHVDGWSEAVVEYIAELETAEVDAARAGQTTMYP
jgi:hypothetical protein